MVLYIIVESRKGDTVLGLGVFYTAFVMQYKKIINMFFLFFFCPTFQKVEKSISQNARVVQGGRLKIDCVRTRGFKPHFWQWGARLWGARLRGARLREHRFEV